ncbi:MAG: hypothetical protein LKJ45_05345 [Oscillospiraceae bacterium]|nr:hypothetical protein [Oscillospiraceae bacterium]
MLQVHYTTTQALDDKGGSLSDCLQLWYKEAQKLRKGEISKEEYDTWRYTFPEIEVEQTKAALKAIRDKEKINSEKESHPIKES